MPVIPDSPVLISGLLVSIEPVDGRDDNNVRTGTIVAYKVLIMDGAAALQVKVPADRYDVIPDAELVPGTFTIWSVTPRAWKMQNGNHGVTFTYQNRVKEADLLALVTRLEAARELTAA